MSTVLKIRAALDPILSAIQARVWYEKAPDKATFPYLVYLLNSVDTPGLERFFLDVDGWDAPVTESTVALDTMMDSVDQALHKRIVTAEGVAFVIYRDRRLPVNDDDGRIRRRKYIYEVRTFTTRSDYHG